MHGYLDYVTVLIFFLAPTLLTLSAWASLICYVLAIVHLLMTSFTAFSAGYIRLIPFHIHGWVELAVGIVLAGGPWIINGIFAQMDRVFFTACGILILIIWAVTSYKSPLKGDVEEESAQLF